MRRGAAALLLALAAAAFGGDEGHRVVAGVEDGPEAWTDAAAGSGGLERGFPRSLGTLLDRSREMRVAPFSATVTAVRVPRSTGSAESVVRGEAPLASADDLAALRVALRRGEAEAAHVLRLDGGAGDTVVAGATRDGEGRLALHDESAIGAAAVWSSQGTVEEGLVVRLAAGPSGDGRWRVRLAVRWSEDARVEPVTWIDDREMEQASADAFLAETTYDARPGETAILRAVDASRRARLLLVRVDGTPPPAPLVAAERDGGEWVVVPGGVEDLAEGAEWPAGDAPPARPPRGRGAAEALDPEASHIEWMRDAVGWFRVGQAVGEGTLADVERGLRARRGVASLELTHGPAWRLVLPVAPGSAFRAFAGTLATQFDGVEANPACDDSLVVRERIALGAYGVGVAGVASPDGTVDADLAARVLLDVRTREETGRRDLPGHVAGAPLVVRLPLRRVRELAVGGVPRSDGSFGPRGTTLRFRTGAAEDPWRLAAPIPLEAGDARLAVRPGGGARVVSRTLHPFVRRWRSEGWCGMRARFPEVHAVSEGSDVAVQLAPDGTLDVVAEAAGAPELVERLDAGDGVLDVVRAPFVRFAAAQLAPPPGGRLAGAGGLALHVRCGDGGSGERTWLRFGDAWCLADGPRRVVFEAGGATNLPTDVDFYDSNHNTGEVRSEVRLVVDGVRATLAPRRDGVRVLAVESRSRPQWTQRRLRFATVPQRDGETHLALANVRRAHRSASFDVTDAGLRREPASARDLPLLVLGPDIPSGGDR